MPAVAVILVLAVAPPTVGVSLLAVLTGEWAVAFGIRATPARGQSSPGPFGGRG